MLMPVQAMITSRLAGVTDSFIFAATLSMATSFVVMVLVCLVLPSGRRALGTVREVWRRRSVPRYFLFAGAIGSCYAFMQAFSVGTIGLAVFAVAIVAARTITSFVVDAVGFSPAGRQPVTRRRLVAAALLIVGAVIASLGAGTNAQGESVGQSEHAWAFVLLAALVGAALSFQQAMNGRSGRAYGSPVIATTVNYAVGAGAMLGATTVVAAISAARRAAGAEPSTVNALPSMPPEWWGLIAGPLGILFVLTGVVLVPVLGSLLTGIGIVTGQLLGSLVLDALLEPWRIGINDILGTLITLGAVVLASWRRQPRSNSRQEAT